MQAVSDAFLLEMATISAALFGLFMVGMLFYVETGFRQLGAARDVVVPYFRASTRIVLILFAIPLFLSLTLVVLEPVWSRILFALLSLVLIAANLDTGVRIRTVQRVTRSNVLLVNEVVGSVGVVLIVVLPWVLGGIDPTREDLTWAILISFAAAFLSLAALILSVFDIAMSR
ncbi:MAG: hypothetical protein ACR2N5_05940 [Solirubrobacterales bacterium]